MLGKTANGLFWMSRYLERAENIARLVETGQRIALTRSGPSAESDDWFSILQTAGVHGGYSDKHEDTTKETAIDWLLRDGDNHSAVLTCISAARQNARMVRTALTHEVWEAVNAAYMEARELLARRVNERDLPAVLGAIRQKTALVRGATHGTMLRNDIYDFLRIGTFLERGDNTARILDVKYYVLLPSARMVGSSLDNVQWETILRSVSASGGFQMVHGADVSPRSIAEFLILDRRMPRSLYFCASKLHDNLTYLAADYGTVMESHATAEALVHKFREIDVDSILDFGLHEFIQSVIGTFFDLGRQIEIDYRFYE